MNFPRIVIVLMLVASAVFGWLLYQNKQELAQVRSDLKKVPMEAQSIQELGLQLQSLLDARDKDGLAEMESPEFYITSVATDPKIAIGQVDINSSSKEAYRGVLDRQYRIKPSSKTKEFHRSQVGNFLYQLEAESRRIRVTNFKLTPTDKLKPGEIGRDSWTFEAEVTSREKTEG